MYFAVRAMKYLRKKLGKTLFMGLIFFVIANFVLAGLLIQQASNLAKENTRRAIGADITLIQDWEGILADLDKGLLDDSVLGKIKGEQGILSEEAFTENGAPTVSILRQLASSDFVSSHQITLSLRVSGRDYTQIQVESDVAGSTNFTAALYDSNIPEAFLDGTAKIIEGRLLEEEELRNGLPLVLVEERFARSNRLGAGDSIVIEFPELDEMTHTQRLEIAGIYRSSEGAGQEAVESGDATTFVANRFYMPINVLVTAGYEQAYVDNAMVLNHVIRLKDPGDKDAFEAESQDKLNLRYGTLDANDAMYEALVGPIEAIGLISNIAVVIILATGGLIIGLITALTVNERRSEVGILLAVGESKTRIVSQFIMEVLVIAVITFSISLISGAVMGQQISRSSLASEFMAVDQDKVETKNWKMGLSGWEAEALKVTQPELEISLSLTVILMLFGVGIALTVISTIIPSLYVMRYNPKQILNNRVS